METHNTESSEKTTELEKIYTSDAIGSTLFSKSWVLTTLNSIDKPDQHIGDLESLSEMSCSEDVARFLGLEAHAHFKLLSWLLQSSCCCYRVQELCLVILCNILQQNFHQLRSEATCIDIPLGIILPSSAEDWLQNSDPDFVQVLIALFQYLTIYNDFLSGEEESFDETQDFIQHNFDLVPNVAMIMASTMNAELLAKATRYLFSVLELASETKEPMSRIGQLLSPPALGCFNEALKQAQENTDTRTAFIIVEILAGLFA